jgi:molybdopterin converting factor small subunit
VNPHMNVKVLFFGATASITKTREMEFATGADISAGGLCEVIVAEFPQLASHKLFVAIDQQHAGDADPIPKGAEIAVFTAVSGG